MRQIGYISYGYLRVESPRRKFSAMTAISPRHAKEAELAEIEKHLVLRPDALSLYLESARLLMELGRREEARETYLKVLAKDPMNFIAMNNLGTLMLSMGHRDAARSAYETVIKYWAHPTAYVNLGNLSREAHDHTTARKYYEAALRLIAVDQAKAYQGLSHTLMDVGEVEAAEKYRRLGFTDNAVTVSNYRGDGPPIRVVAFISAAGGNIPNQPFMDDEIFLISTIVADFFDPNRPLPEHQLIFNGIGDVEIAEDALHAAIKLLEKTQMPVINPPAKVLPTSRAGNAERLKSIPGLIVPKVMVLPRADITPEKLTQHGFHFPVLLRRPGFHGGQYFLKADNIEDLPNILSQIPGDEFTVIQYVDTRSVDGKTRKYRVMMVGGELYPLHAAVSQNWKIHYFSADMKSNPDHRAEDAEFLENMPKVLGPRAMKVLKDIQDTLGLDYAGIDFGLTPDGDVILFETNATMVIAQPAIGQEWDYRRAPVNRIIEAVKTMILMRVPSKESSS